MDVMKPRVLYVVSGFLAVALLGSAVLLAWGYWQVYGIGGWRDQLYASEGAVASRQALDDFRAGHLRLYTLGGESERAKFTGTNDGPFEVWTPHFYPSLGVAHRYATEQFIEFYNRKMKYMHEHPKEFLRKGQEVQQSHAADGSQPFRTDVVASLGYDMRLHSVLLGGSDFDQAYAKEQQTRVQRPG